MVFVPKYLEGHTPPAAAAEAARCPECADVLCLTPSGHLACGRSLGHGRLKPLDGEDGVAQRIREAWPLLARPIRPRTVWRRLVSVLPEMSSERHSI